MSTHILPFRTCITTLAHSFDQRLSIGLVIANFDDCFLINMTVSFDCFLIVFQLCFDQRLSMSVGFNLVSLFIVALSLVLLLISNVRSHIGMSNS